MKDYRESSQVSGVALRTQGRGSRKLPGGRKARGSSLGKRKLTQIRSLHWSWDQATRHSQITELVAIARDREGRRGGRKWQLLCRPGHSEEERKPERRGCVLGETSVYGEQQVT